MKENFRTRDEVECFNDSLSDEIELRVAKKCTDNSFLLFIAFRQYLLLCCQPIRLQDSVKVLSNY